MSCREKWRHLVDSLRQKIGTICDVTLSYSLLWDVVWKHLPFPSLLPLVGAGAGASGDEQTWRGRSAFHGRVRSCKGCRGTGIVTAKQRLRYAAGIWSPVLPPLVAPLCEAIKDLVVIRIDHIPDVSGYLPGKQDLDDIVQGVQLQGDELVYQDRGLSGGPANGRSGKC